MICRRQFFDSVTYRQDFARNFPVSPAFRINLALAALPISYWRSRSRFFGQNFQLAFAFRDLAPIILRKRSVCGFSLSSGSLAARRKKSRPAKCGCPRLRPACGTGGLIPALFRYARQLFGKTRNLGHFYAPTRRITICGTGGLGQHGHGGICQHLVADKGCHFVGNVRVRKSGIRPPAGSRTAWSDW